MICSVFNTSMHLRSCCSEDLHDHVKPLLGVCHGVLPTENQLPHNYMDMYVCNPSVSVSLSLPVFRMSSCLHLLDSQLCSCLHVVFQMGNI